MSIIKWLINKSVSEPARSDLRQGRIQKFSGGACPQTPLGCSVLHTLPDQCKFASAGPDFSLSSLSLCSLPFLSSSSSPARGIGTLQRQWVLLLKLSNYLCFANRKQYIMSNSHSPLSHFTCPEGMKYHEYFIL